MGSKITSKMDAQSLYRDIMDYIFAATELVKQGDYIELAGLDEHVTKMCTIIQNMNVEESLSMKDDLDHMMQELDTLQKLFIETRDRVAKEINGIGKHRQAAVAYKQSENTSTYASVMDPSFHEDDQE